ncbi:RagB/SusD family nutrient uptake outer membrane protein [Odoribacter sp. OttesenSCG-928-G04]|nr:RagB/SusD family nutrient uptake outer membrane protein [Odoribacter sp. OttesenSCG-928-G04]
MKNSLKYIVLCLLLGGMTACNDFLEEKPEGGVEQDETIESMSDMEKSLTTVYAMAKSSSLFTGNAILAPELQCDYAQAVSGASYTNSMFYQWNFTAQTTELSGVWAGFWAMISTANFVIQNEEKANPETEADTIRLKSIVAEAHLARALAYSEMVKIWSDPYGKDLGGNAVSPETQLALPIWDVFEVGTPARASMYDYYQHILNDIKVAKEGITRDVVDDFYFTKGAVYALETRVHVAMGNWEEAIKSASYVIDSCQYTLLSAIKEEGQTTSDYENMWINDEGAEIIWKVALTRGKLNGVGTMGTPFYYTTQGVHWPEYVPAKWVLDLYSEADARYDIFFDEQTTGYAHQLKWPLLKKYPGNPDLRTGTNSTYTNMPKVFRLSEVYLLRAEAYLESGNEEKAKDDLRTLLEKRTTALYSLSDVRKVIQEERVRELYMEGHRMYDLKRWGMGFERKGQSNTLAPLNTMKVEASNVFFTWPIPSHELDIPGSQIVPNPSNLR